MALREKYNGRYVDAETATNYIDAPGIIKSANSIKEELEEFSNLSSDVKNAGSDLNAETLYVDGFECAPLVDEVASGITVSYTSMIGNLDEIIAAAEAEYNKKQDELNQIAKERDRAEIARREAEAAAQAGNN